MTVKLKAGQGEICTKTPRLTRNNQPPRLVIPMKTAVIKSAKTTAVNTAIGLGSGVVGRGVE